MNYLKEIVSPEQRVNPLFTLLGIRAATIEPGLAVLELPFSDGLVQGAGVVAGGILSTLLDEAMAHAAIASLPGGEAARLATADLHVRFLAPVRPGTDLRAEARVVRQGANVLFLEAEAEAGTRTVAKGSATFLIRTPPCQQCPNG